jgi:hypothetical protein
MPQPLRVGGVLWGREPIRNDLTFPYHFGPFLVAVSISVARRNTVPKAKRPKRIPHQIATPPAIRAMQTMKKALMADRDAQMVRQQIIMVHSPWLPHPSILIVGGWAGWIV